MGCGNTKPSVEVAGPDNSNEISRSRITSADEKKEKNLSHIDFPPPKPVSFEVNFKDDNPFKRPPPPRLTRLAPLEGVAKLSHEQLMEKLEQAESARSIELEKKRTLSRKSSRRRMSIIQAREFDKENQAADIEHNLRLKEEKRLAILEEKKAKVRRQEENRRRARAKTRRLSEGPADEVANLDLECDTTFNRGDHDRDEVDSWLDGHNDAKQANQSRDGSGNYSNNGHHGNRDSRRHSNKMDDESISVRGFSAQTHESLNVANSRQEKVRILPFHNDVDKATDDFFDS